MTFSRWKLHDFCILLAFLDFDRPIFFLHKVDVFLNNGSLNLKNHQNFLNLEHKLSFHKVLPKKWQKRHFHGWLWGVGAIATQHSWKSVFLLFHSPLKGSLLQINKTRTTNWLETRLQIWIQISERPVFSKILIRIVNLQNQLYWYDIFKFNSSRS